MLERGLWVVIEGADGTGKTTTMECVAHELQRAHPDLEIIKTRHPGSTPLGRHIRKLVKSPHEIDQAIDLDNLSEQLLMAVDHVNFRNKLLGPALERGAIVLADRCNLVGGLVYGMAAGMTALQVNAIYNLIAASRVDRMYVLTCPEEMRQQRLRSRKLDHFEVRQGIAKAYDQLVTGPPERTILVNRIVALDNIKYVSTDVPVEDVAAKIVADVTSCITK